MRSGPRAPRNLPRYVAQWVFMHNTRKLDDGERVKRAIQKTVGKRLLYQAPEQVQD